MSREADQGWERPLLKIAVIVDRGAVQKFALDTLDAIEGNPAIAVFSCTNTKLTRRLLRHAGYYALNVLSVRNPLSRFVPVDSGTKTLSMQVEFQSGQDGAWQTFPPEVVAKLRDFDVILKFGMGLLRVPAPEQLSVPILSYHHGDPERYRGRPAGYWEITDGCAVMGQMVQIISNRLDAGAVVAYAETRVIPWSWRKTLIEAFRHSPLLINRAIRNALSGTILPMEATGKNCRLPSNFVAARFALRQGRRIMRRLRYGAVVEKAWRVSTAPIGAMAILDLADGRFPNRATWHTFPVSRGYSFYADPFFHGDKGILVEALKAVRGVGEIMLITGDEHKVVAAGKGHMSYPSTSLVNGRELVIPEAAGWSRPVIYELKQERLKPIVELDVEGDPRLLDPTVFEHNGKLYLFANIRSIGGGALYLWCAEALDGRFKMHPASPIRISPAGSRMGGAILRERGRLIRFGQDFTGDYGNGLIALNIEQLTPDKYNEQPVGVIRTSDCKGPHTLNLRDGVLLFDTYREQLAPLAGVRRLLAALSARKSHGDQ
jgi:hypothetical protein